MIKQTIYNNLKLNKMETISIAINTTNDKVQVSLGDNIYRDIKVFTHPITNEKYFCFISSKKILENTYLLSGIFAKKTEYANIFNEEYQKKISEYIAKN